MNTVVIINKPKGITSHDVIARVRAVTGVKRVGHAGTLDPLASGVLIVLIGREETKRQNEFMGMPKSYEAEITFGSTSATYDAEGPLTPSCTFEQLRALTTDMMKEVLPRFTGTILQQPPAHSAIKVNGTPLYKKARRGTVQQSDIPTRSVQIDSIEVQRFVPATPPFPPTARITVDCQKGTYIRSLAHDIGAALGTGAYLSDLIRTAVGPYRIEDSLTLEEFAAKWQTEAAESPTHSNDI